MTTLTINPSASSHDAWENNLGAVTLTDEIRLTAATAWGGLFLPNVTIGRVNHQQRHMVL